MEEGEGAVRGVVCGKVLGSCVRVDVGEVYVGRCVGEVCGVWGRCVGEVCEGWCVGM